MQCLALNLRNQGAPLALADHGVTFPVTEAPTTIDASRAFIGRYLVGNAAASAISAIGFVGPSDSAGNSSGHPLIACLSKRTGRSIHGG